LNFESAPKSKNYFPDVSSTLTDMKGFVPAGLKEILIEFLLPKFRAYATKKPRRGQIMEENLF
jgi:hypothetical protein